jgi:pantetheine-phosphate adenylyltransferase
MRKAIFPGHLIPFRGHEDIIKEGISLFDETVLVSMPKKYMFPLEERKDFIEETLK